eukprot:CAMPEP_0115027936 /NCGR_PEP_ID=MMETSP0216-20121206/35919_1 /TAXON_ID=223996 /ORGANISM="Protocruzia adherens, Strain Boccale" /LENGTH=624 /DNA_ID=CAMNT_0002403859 /DNA_START=184 /DNA_END=2058 /DNA_ORIENTATION=+
MDLNAKDEEIRIVKQMCLRKEIASKRYDTDRFVAFCKAQKEGGEEIDNWTLEELQEMVVDFKLKYNDLLKQSTGESFKDKGILEDTSSVDSADFEGLSQEKSVNELSSDFDQSDFMIESFMRSATDAHERRRSTIDMGVKARTQMEMSEMVIRTRCRSIERGPVSNFSNVTVAVVDAKIVPGSFFSPNYVSYSVKTEPFDWTVRRRYSDFQWLRMVLRKTFPGYIIPPIPEKQTSGRFKQDFIEYRRVFFSYFLASLLQNEIFRRSKCVEIFLSVVDSGLFKARKKEYLELEGPRCVEDYYTLDGYINLEVTEERITYIEVFPTFLSQFESQLQKSAILSRQLSEDYDRVSSTLKQMAECFSEIHAVNQATFKNELNPMGQIFDTLSSVTNMWGVTYEENTAKINENFSEFFTYAACEIPSVRELIKRYQHYKTKYYNVLYRLLSRKDKLYASREVGRWEMSVEDIQRFSPRQLLEDKELAFAKMLYVDTIQVEKIRVEYAFFAHQTYEELKRTKIEYLLKYRDHFTKTARDESTFIAKLHVMWADLISNLSVYSNVRPTSPRGGENGYPNGTTQMGAEAAAMLGTNSPSDRLVLKKGLSEPSKRLNPEDEESKTMTKSKTYRR